jgi:polar amino acid transport system substrate-binding protein
MPYSLVREKMPRLLDAVLDGSRRIKRIIEDLKDFARQEKSGLGERKDIGDIVESAVSLMGSMIEKSTTRFAVEKEEGIPQLYCNAQRLEQVIVNLLQNACQALPDATKAIEVSVRYIEEEHAVKVTVRDEGVGMSEEVLKHIGNAFFTTRGDSGGTGLGLFVSDRIVKEHGGTLDFESREGRGTTAVLTLPAGRAPDAEGNDP